MLTIVIVLGLVYFVQSLLMKWRFYDWFSEWAVDKGKFFYRLSNCHYCMTFWTCVFCSLIGVTFRVLELSFLLTPFVVFGVYNFLDNGSRS